MPFYTRGNKLYNNKLRYNLLPIDKNVIYNHINSSTANRLVGKNPATDRLVYSSQNPYGGVGDAGTWVRNPNCWINGVSNISCFSPAQRSGANWWQRAGTLVTTRHFIQATHFTTAILPNGGTPIIFVDENNNAIRRNLIAYDFAPNDIAIGLLDNDVPSNIKIAKVLPPNYKDYIQALNINGSELFGLLSVGLDQEEKALVKTITTISTFINFDNMSGPSGGVNPYPEWSETIIVGDSGNPIFLIIDNELVLISTWLSPTAGPFMTTHYNAINEAINRLSSNQGYSLTPINLELVYHKYS
jgi:hypothetical protein